MIIAVGSAQEVIGCQFSRTSKVAVEGSAWFIEKENGALNLFAVGVSEPNVQYYEIVKFETLFLQQYDFSSSWPRNHFSDHCSGDVSLTVTVKGIPAGNHGLIIHALGNITEVGRLSIFALSLSLSLSCFLFFFFCS
jgi:hypothetical protein